MPDESPWVIKGVSERTRRKVKAFAAERSVTMAQAVEFLVDIAFANQDMMRSRLNQTAAYFKYIGRLGSRGWGENFDLLARVEDIKEKRREGQEVDMEGLWDQELEVAGLLEMPKTEDQ